MNNIHLHNIKNQSVKFPIGGDYLCNRCFWLWEIIFSKYLLLQKGRSSGYCNELTGEKRIY